MTQDLPFGVSLLAAMVVVAFALFLIGLTAVAFAKPALAKQFFTSFASSARAHYAEQAIRLLIGSSIVARSSAMWQPDMFRLIGWATVVSSLVLILIPWQWHHRFGKLVLPMVVRHMRVYAVGLFAFGALLLYAVLSAASRGEV